MNEYRQIQTEFESKKEKKNGRHELPRALEKIETKSYEDNETLSVIIRCHQRERLPFLEEAIFSLSIQDWTDLQIIVVIQNGDDNYVRDVREIILHQPWREDPKFIIRTVEFKRGLDGRSALLNHGIKYSSGRFLAFLDDDDVVYQHGYKTLIDRLLKNDEGEEEAPAIAVGGCRVAKTQRESDNWFISAKETPFTFGRNRFDLFRDNFIPIHSYVIDRKNIDARDLYFDNDILPLEDYDFLLRLSSKYDFDFSNLDVFVCEYRIHNANSLPYTEDATQEKIDKYRRAFDLINQRKKSLLCRIPLTDLIEIMDRETPVKAFSTSEEENPQVIRRILVGWIDNLYSFLHTYPKLEIRLSKTVHYGWRILRGGDEKSLTKENSSKKA